MLPKKIITLFLFACMTSTAIVYSQPEGGLSIKELEILEALPDIPDSQQRAAGEIGFAVYTYGKLSEPIYYFRDEVPVEVQHSAGAIRRFQFGKFMEAVTFFVKRLDEEGQVIYKPYVHAQIPEGLADGVVFLKERDLNEEKSQSTAILLDLTSSKFKKDEYRMVNFTPVPIYVQVGQMKKRLDPMGEVTMSPSEDYLPVKVAIMNNNQAKFLYTNYFQRDSEQRVLIVVAPDFSGTNGGQGSRCIIYKDRGEILR
jgi:hypothetical protein